MAQRFELLPDERIILSDESDNLVLTNMRVRYTHSFLGSSQVTSMTLDAVASVGIARSSRPILLVLAVAVVLAGAAAGESVIQPAIVLAVLLVGAYFGTRRTVLSITSCGGEDIEVPANALGMDASHKFINRVEKMKLNGRDA